jgi:hypothetical protein
LQPGLLHIQPLDQPAAAHGSSSTQGWEGDVFFADGAEGVRLSELKKALADAGEQLCVGLA